MLSLLVVFVFCFIPLYFPFPFFLRDSHVFYSHLVYISESLDAWLYLSLGVSLGLLGVCLCLLLEGLLVELVLGLGDSSGLPCRVAGQLCHWAGAVEVNRQGLKSFVIADGLFCHC
jgi:hypothetical protein